VIVGPQKQIDEHAAVHKYKANADDAETCQELIKECFCSDILMGDEQKCGIYRK
jgi:hypothetical protein